MVATEAVAAIETLSARDADAGLRLSREANWNQTHDDWLFFLRSGAVFGLRGVDGTLIATAALLPSPPVTWISMVLVAQRWRRRGLADRLMNHCVAEAERRGLEPWLDATPAGAAVYRRIAFTETGFGLVRMRRPAADGHVSIAREADDARVSELARQDRDALGFDRSPLLASLARRSGSTIHHVGTAMALVREGDRARHIGPVFADDAAQATDLLERIVTEERGSLLIDVASHAEALTGRLGQRGFSVERPFARMRLGQSSIGAPGARLFAAAGPEFG